MGKLLETKENWLLSPSGSQWELKEMDSLACYEELQIRLKNTTPFTLTLDVRFVANSGQILMISFDTLPETEVTVPIALSYLDSQQLFPPRTDGRLRMMVNGLPIEKAAVKSLVISSRPCHEKRRIEKISVSLSEQITKGVIHDPQCLIDHLGQWSKKAWTGKVFDKGTLKEQLTQRVEKMPDKQEIIYQTGFFHLEKKAGRWFLLDPNGQDFCSVGMDCVGPSMECNIEPIRALVPPEDQKYARIDYVKRNLKETFGATWYENWQKLTAGYLKEWGVNTIGAWSDLSFVHDQHFPYVVVLDSLGNSGYPDTDVKIFRDFPDVFAPTYERRAKEYAKAIVSLVDDPFLIGYFMRNEPQWAFEYGIDLATELLKMTENSYTKQALIHSLEKKYENITDFCAAWYLSGDSIKDVIEHTHTTEHLSLVAIQDLQDFSREMIRQYVKVPAQAIRALDSNHLNLGMRYAYLANEAMAAGCDYFDVFSINCYQEDPTDKIEQVAQITGKPVMIGEFHFGGLDKGLTATGIKGCQTQKERAQAFDHYLAKASEHPNFIGAHYFALYDQPCLGRFDGENYQFGFLDVCSQPYQEMIENRQLSATNLLEIHQKGCSNVRKAALIPSIYC